MGGYVATEEMQGGEAMAFIEHPKPASLTLRTGAPRREP
jgi:hypothetical protein